MELIAVVLKSPTGQQRFEDAKTLLNYGFSTYGLVHAAPEEPLPPVPVTLGTRDAVQSMVDRAGDPDRHPERRNTAGGAHPGGGNRGKAHLRGDVPAPGPDHVLLRVILGGS